MGNWRFGAFPKLPYSTMQQLNLDWILDRIRRFLPDTGTKGQVLTRTKDGAAWQDATAGGGAVNSVNGQTGDVVLDAEDVGALPDTYTAPVTSVNGQTGDVSLNLGVTSIRADYQGGGAVGVNTGDVSLVGQGCLVNTVYPGMVQVVASKSTIGLGSVVNERQYSAQNPPPYPVTSVNGQTGAVVLDAEDVGALPDSYTAPVSSVNGMTGAVVIPTSSTTVYHKKITGTTTSSGSLVTGLKRDDYIIIGVTVNRQTSGYYTSSYNLLPSGADTSGNLIFTAVIPTSSGTTTLGNTAIAVDIYYIDNNATEE